MDTNHNHALSLPQGLTRIESEKQEEAMVAWFRTKVHDGRIKYTSSIPQKKLETARSVCEVPENEQVLLFIDGTNLGTAKECLLITWSAVYLKWSSVLPPKILDFSQFRDVELQIDKGGINVMIGRDVYFSPGWADVSAVLLLLQSLQEVLVNGVVLDEEATRNIPDCLSPHSSFLLLSLDLRNANEFSNIFSETK
jgi:hypothetical protein